MDKKMNIEAEGGELVMRNTAGDIAIIPKEKRTDALYYMESGDMGAINNIIEGLPNAKSYADKGTKFLKKPNVVEPARVSSTYRPVDPGMFRGDYKPKGYEGFYQEEYDKAFAKISKFKQRGNDWTHEEQAHYIANNVAQRKATWETNPEKVVGQYAAEAALNFIPEMPFIAKGIGLLARGVKNAPKAVKSAFKFPPAGKEVVLGKKAYQLRALSEGHPLTKQLNKYGQINTDALRQYKKMGTSQISQADRNMINLTLNKHYPGQKKVDFNEFLGKISDDLGGFNASPTSQYSNYGLERIGYGNNAKDVPLASIDENIARAQVNAHLEEHALTKGNKLVGLTDTFEGQGTIRARAIKSDGKEFEYIISKDDLPIFNTNKEGLIQSNETLLWKNPKKFGKGSGKHFDDPDVLGHSRYFVSEQEPNIFHAVETQSDYFQKGVPTQRDTPEFFIEKQKQAIANQEAAGAKLNVDDVGQPYINEFYKDLNSRKKVLADQQKLTNTYAEQKLLEPNIQSRLHQENMAYASNQGQTIYRIPTRETGAKIQKYSLKTNPRPAGYQTPEGVFRTSELEAKERFKASMKNRKALIEKDKKSLLYADERRIPQDQINVIKDRIDVYERNYARLLKKDVHHTEAISGAYSDKHETILRHYKDAPNVIKKSTGLSPKNVTDKKGNSWYEFKIPQGFGKGKNAIKAFGSVALPLGVASQLIPNG